MSLQEYFTVALLKCHLVKPSLVSLLSLLPGIPWPSCLTEWVPCILTAHVQAVTCSSLGVLESGQDCGVRQAGESGVYHLPAMEPWRTGSQFMSSSPALGLAERRWAGNATWAKERIHDWFCEAPLLLCWKGETMIHSNTISCRTWQRPDPQQVHGKHLLKAQIQKQLDDPSSVSVGVSPELWSPRQKSLCIKGDNCNYYWRWPVIHN